MHIELMDIVPLLIAGIALVTAMLILNRNPSVE
ncbi:MAG: hypothetical protein PWQ88_882 [Candidatus Methanomethylophilaceae archaeon]|nr:hypothetical protein [Candidatus Methanomethylophilaceae archaeon]MDI3541990.1 hypothetical protein [Candidatus Methanomethylophilaceae archaeon]